MKGTLPLITHQLYIYKSDKGSASDKAISSVSSAIILTTLEYI